MTIDELFRLLEKLEFTVAIGIGYIIGKSMKDTALIDIDGRIIIDIKELREVIKDEI
ncbi:MAG: hypothetical protein ACTSPB_03480 [Candidatus Thorarchaeota archaeon]